jgi:hypothetical protein
MRHLLCAAALVGILYAANGARAVARSSGKPSTRESALARMQATPPPGLKFSLPVNGVAVALRGPTEARVLDPLWAHLAFEVYILNLGDRTLALSRHTILVRIALYNSKGRSVTDLQNYGNELGTSNPTIEDLVILRPGEMLRTFALPWSVDATRLSEGTYEAAAIVIGPPARWWTADIVRRLKGEGITIWRPARAVSPRHRVELR